MENRATQVINTGSWVSRFIITARAVDSPKARIQNTLCKDFHAFKPLIVEKNCVVGKVSWYISYLTVIEFPLKRRNKNRRFYTTNNPIFVFLKAESSVLSFPISFSLVLGRAHSIPGVIIKIRGMSAITIDKAYKSIHMFNCQNEHICWGSSQIFIINASAGSVQVLFNVRSLSRLGNDHTWIHLGLPCFPFRRGMFKYRKSCFFSS